MQARTQAAADALERAELYGAPMGATVGDVLVVSESPVHVTAPSWDASGVAGGFEEAARSFETFAQDGMMAAAPAAGMSKAAPMPISSKRQTISAVVFAVYELCQGTR